MGEIKAAIASSAIWCFMAMVIRGLLVIMGSAFYVPEGLIFSLPLLIQYASSSTSSLGVLFSNGSEENSIKQINENYFSFLMEQLPILPVCIAGYIRGKIAGKDAMWTILAQVVGYTIGLCFFLLLFGWVFNPNPGTVLFNIQANPNIFGGRYNDALNTKSGSLSCIIQDGYRVIGQCNNENIGQGNNKTLACFDESIYTASELNDYVQSTQRWQMPMDLIQDIFFDSTLSCAYCILVLIGQEMCTVNQRSIYWMSVLIIIITLLHSFLLHSNSHSSAFNPIAALLLWLVNPNSLSGEEFENIAKVCGSSNSVGGVIQDVTMKVFSSILRTDEVDKLFLLWYSSSIRNSIEPFSNLILPVFSELTQVMKGFEIYFIKSTLFLEHFFGCIIGGVMAGFICLKIAPDDPNSWKHRKH